MRVLIAVEDELFGGACADFVNEHTWQPGTIFKVLHAVEPVYIGDRITSVYGGDLQHQILEERMSCGRDVVAKVKQRIEQKLPPGTLIESNVIAGSPHHVILETAETWHADMIIMGSHGRAGFDRFVMGSISLAVLSHAKCSVSIVRLPDESKRKTKHTEKKSEQAVTA